MKYATCGFCSKSFRYRPNKRFCSDRCRLRSWGQGIVEEGPACTYCGVVADSIDHVPPKSVRGIILAEGATRWPFVEVNCCRECNFLLGDRMPWTVRERKVKIKQILARRYRRYLALPRWTDEELQEMDERSILKGYIREGILLAKAVRLRLDW